MKRDPIVLGRDYVLSGEDIGKTRPNANVLIVGTTGCGKSVSVILPTMARLENSNPILNYAKPRDACAMARYLEHKGYKVDILDIAHPDRSTISFDPLLSVESYEDIDSLSAFIVDGVITHTTDDYWQAKSKSLLAALTASVCLDDVKVKKKKSMLEVLRLFDETLPVDNGLAVVSRLHMYFKRIERDNPGCYAVREYNAWESLPFKTASCVRDTLASALNMFFPESIRKMMQQKPQFDVKKFCSGKEAVIIITDAMEKNQNYYANLFYRDTERQLLRYAAACPNGELPREVRYFFDDFACTAPIEGFANDISLFRAAGISAVMLLQSERQLEAVYKDDAAVIRQNCAVYAYFPGGFDDRSCEIVSRRMGLPYDEILYAPLGKVFIMQSGQKPVHIYRYDTLESEEYREYLEISGNRIKKKRNIRAPMDKTVTKEKSSKCLEPEVTIA